MCSNFLGMGSTLTKKIITIFFIFWDIFINYLILFVTFFSVTLPFFHTQKIATHCKEQNKKKNYDNWLRNKKVIQWQKMSKKCPKNSKFLVSKYIKVPEFKTKPKTFLRKGIKHKKNDMEGLNSKNKNIEGSGSS